MRKLFVLFIIVTSMALNTHGVAQTKEKKESHGAKGAIIGAVAGAGVGAAVSHDKSKGAIIGGAVGAGTGYAIGHKKKYHRKKVYRKS